MEHRPCACDYQVKGYTSRDEARRMAMPLDLQSGRRLLDVGAGAGWPGLYFAKEMSCDAVLVDLPLHGLQVAIERAARDQISDRCRVAVADGSRLPFRDASIDAASHSEVLCCLEDKRVVEAAASFGESETDYHTLLGQTGWTVTDCLDVSESYASSNAAVREGLLRRDLFVAAPDLT